MDVLSGVLTLYIKVTIFLNNSDIPLVVMMCFKSNPRIQKGSRERIIEKRKRDKMTI